MAALASAPTSSPTTIRSTITSLSVVHLSCSVPPATRLPHLSASLTELELSDCSYTHAVEQGAVNVLLQHPNDVIDRSDAMVEFALAMPHLRRLSLSCAAFSADSLLRLASLPHLESLSIAGAMTCMEGPAGAAAAYRALLAALPRLRQLRLPMAVDAPGCVRRWDDSSDSEGEGEEEQEQEDRGEGQGGGGARGGLQREQRGEGHGRDSDSDGGSEASDETAVPPALRGARALGRTSRSSNSGNGATRCMALQSSLEQSDQSPEPSPFSSAQGWAACLAASGPSALLHVASGNAGQPPRAASAPAIVTRAVTRARQRATGVYKQLKQQRRLRLLSRVPPPSAWVFPPGLADLTIPLCSMNRPVFEAVCAAYGTNTGVAGAGAPVVPPGGQLTALHLPALGGYTHWDGSFLQVRHMRVVVCMWDTGLRQLPHALDTHIPYWVQAWGSQGFTLPHVHFTCRRPDNLFRALAAPCCPLLPRADPPRFRRAVGPHLPAPAARGAGARRAAPRGCTAGHAAGLLHAPAGAHAPAGGAHTRCMVSRSRALRRRPSLCPARAVVVVWRQWCSCTRGRK